MSYVNSAARAAVALTALSSFVASWRCRRADVEALERHRPTFRHSRTLLSQRRRRWRAWKRSSRTETAA